MIRKRVIALVGLLALLAIVVVFFERESESSREYLIDAASGITLEDVEKARKPITFTNSEQGFYVEEPSVLIDSDEKKPEDSPTPEIPVIFSQVNYNTLKFFRYLHRLYADSTNRDDHLNFVFKRLKQQLPEDQAAHLLKVYQDYLQCEIDLAAESAQWTFPTNPGEVLDLLVKIHEYRRKMLGVEMADALFGAEVKSKEYAVRRAIISKDKDLYGEEKEQQLETLNLDMWGDEAELAEQKPKPYHRYREKLQIYRRDFSELSGEERKEKSKEFREMFFSKDVVQKLEAVDDQIENEKAVEQKYFQDQAGILNDSMLTDAQKEEAVFALQNKTFGDQAESFRRREAIRNGLEVLKANSMSAK